MSMLSAQCDELRNLAGDGSVEFVAGPIRADVLRMAADTIWELRCKLNDEQDENARLRSCMSDDADNARLILGENAKLREEVRHLKKGDVLHVLTDQELAEQQKHEREMQASINALDDENVKLRELVRDYVNAPCTTCDCWDDNFRCWNYDGADCGLVARARELGVEVDE